MVSQETVYNGIYANVENYNFNSKLKNYLVDLYAAGIKGPLLDAGCGQGIHLKRMLSHHIDAFGIELSRVCFEKFLKDYPAENTDIQTFSKTCSRVFSGLICMDVLEHIPPEDLDSNLQALHRLSPASAMFGIANHSDILNGVELHLIRENQDWWLQRLSSVYKNIELVFQSDDGRFFMILCGDSPLPDNRHLYRSLTDLCPLSDSLQSLEEYPVLLKKIDAISRELDALQERYSALLNTVAIRWANRIKKLFGKKPYR